MAEVSDDMRDAMVENAKGPKRVTTDGVSVEQHGLPDQIAAINNAANNEAAKLPHRGLRFTQMRVKGPGY